MNLAPGRARDSQNIGGQTHFLKGESKILLPTMRQAGRLARRQAEFERDLTCSEFGQTGAAFGRRTTRVPSLIRPSARPSARPSP